MPEAEEDLAYWKATGNKRIMRRITKLLEDILQHPFTGIGKPEPLKGDLHGVWSRRNPCALLCPTDKEKGGNRWGCLSF